MLPLAQSIPLLFWGMKHLQLTVVYIFVMLLLYKIILEIS